MIKEVERNILVGKIVNFCFDYDILDDSSIAISEITDIIEQRLDEAHFLESLINTIIVKTKTCKHIDVDIVKELLIELEKIRLELEYKVV